MTKPIDSDVNSMGPISGSDLVYPPKAETREVGTPPPDRLSGTESDPPKRRQKVIIKWRKRPLVDPQVGEPA